MRGVAVLVFALSAASNAVMPISGTGCAVQAVGFSTDCPEDEPVLIISDYLSVAGSDPPPAVNPGETTVLSPAPVYEGPALHCNNENAFCALEPGDDPVLDLPGETVDPITIEDLASFAPDAGQLVVQPDGWGIEGQDTNVYVTAGEHTQEGELLGEPIEVRWTVASVTFDYGDGAIVTSDDGGSAWATGDELDPTSTSHVYEERGEYTVSADVSFAAEVLVDDAWVAVPGTIDVTPDAVDIRIYRVDTVLVRGDCIQYPNDPGCPGWDPPADP